MFVAKFDKEGILWRVTIFEKNWCEEVFSNEVKQVQSKKFLFHSSGYRWINKEICKRLFDKHELEIING
jgi:hypothetical protein